MADKKGVIDLSGFDEEVAKEQTSDIDLSAFDEETVPKPQEPMSAAEAAWLSMPSVFSGKLGGATQAALQLPGITEEALAKSHPIEKAVGSITPGYALIKSLLQPEQREKIAQAYGEGEKLQKGLIEKARHDQPLASMAGEIAGGFAIPVPAGKARAGEVAVEAYKAARAAGKAKDAARALATAKAAIQGGKEAAKMGATAGAIVGAGQAEDIIEKPLEALKTVGKGAAVGAGLGLAAPVALKAMTAPVKGLTNFIKNLESTQKFIQTKGRAAGGEKLIGVAGREEATRAQEKISKEVLDQINVAKKAAGKSLDDITKGLTDQGKVIDISESIDPAIQKLDDLILSGKTPKIREDAKIAKEALEANLRELKGYAAKVDDPALAKLKEQQAKLRLAQKAKETQVLGKEGIKKQVATKIEAAKAKKEAQLNKLIEDIGEDPTTMSLSEKESIIRDRFPDLELPRVPEFAAPKTLINKETGKKVVQMMDEETGQTVQKAVDDFDPTTSIIKVDDPVTGKSFYRFKDKATGKTYMRPVTEEAIFEIPQTITPDKARSVVKEISSLSESSFRSADKQVTETVQILNDAYKKLSGQIKDLSDEYKVASTSYQALKDMAERLGVEGEQSVLTATQKIGNELAKFADEGIGASFNKRMFNRWLDAIEQTNPELARNIGSKIKDVAEKLDLSYTQFGLSAVAGPSGKPTIRGGLAGAPVFAGQAIGGMKKRANDLLKAGKEVAPESFISFADDLVSRHGDAAKEFAQALKNVAFQDSRTKRAIMFGLMQRPKFREMIAPVEGEENESESGREK